MDTRTSSNTSSELQPDFGFGIIAGILGGACMAIVMQITGLMTRYTAIIGGTKDIDAWFVLIVLCAILGAGYGVAAYRVHKNWIFSGIAYGLVWWVIGSLIAIPILADWDFLSVGTDTWWALLGNILFGIVTAGVFDLVSRGYGEMVTPQHHA